MLSLAVNDAMDTLGHFFAGQMRLWAGALFMALALAAIQYEEVIAPEMSRLTMGLDSATSDLRTKLASFTL